MSMLIGCHVAPDDPVGEAKGRTADIAQLMLGDPQKWSAPTVVSPGGASALREAAATAGVKLVVHAPYLINVASANNRVRIPSRQLLQKVLDVAATIDALGVVVHGGSPGPDADPSVGVENWFKVVDTLSFPVPLLIENSASGVMTRTLDDWAALWPGIAGAAGAAHVGVCLDTCHAFAGGLDLTTVADDLRAITGRIDLVHANDSQGALGSGLDRHANLGQGQIDPGAMIAALTSAHAPVVVETPGSAAAQAADVAWLRQRLA